MRDAFQFPDIRIRKLPGLQRLIQHGLKTKVCGAPILKSHALGVNQQRQQESRRRDENPERQFPFLELYEFMKNPRPVPAVVTRWRKKIR